MKKSGLLIAALCALLMLSCKKDNPPHQLFVGAVVGNANWLGQPSTNWLANRDTLQVQGVKNIVAGSAQTVTFKVRFNGVGNYTLTTDNQATYLVTMEAGQPTNYRLDTTKTNTVTFTDFNSSTGIASGNFQLYFLKASGNPAADNAVSFTNGHFWIQLP
jgi:uncharacterized protein YfaS (alpha-2-macroglobulin family)